MRKLIFAIALFSMSFAGVANAAYVVKQNNGVYSLENTVTNKEVFKLDRAGVERRDVKVTHFDDFIGDALDGAYSVTSGTDSVAADPAISASDKGIIVVQTGDAVTETAAINGSQLTQELNWDADDGGLVAEFRVLASSATSGVYVVGLTDTKSLEAPVTISNTTATYTATDFAGFVFDSDAVSATWYVAGVANDVSNAVVNTSVAVDTSNYQKLRIELDSSGNADYFINDLFKASIASAVTPTTDLTPIVFAMSRESVSPTISLDYIQVQKNR